MQRMKLSKRLSAVADMVTKGGCVADVGCDHGFVSIYLIQQKAAEHVIAMDVNSGPLARATEHVKACGLEDYIELRLSDGLAKVLPEDHVTSAVIAGMGGRLMEKIIFEALERELYIPEYILAPQSELAAFRSFLRRSGYTIVQETMICEDGKYYPIMKACYGAMRVTGIDYESDVSDAFGPLLLAHKHPVLKEYIVKEKRKFETILQGMQNRGKVETEVTEKLALLKKAEFYREG